MTDLMEKKPIICIMGPTAAGKTDLALTIAKQYNCQIINVDSALIYRDMNIGSAKPSQAILQAVPHYLVDIRDPSEAYSAADFCNDAHIAINKIYSAGATPLLVGGTMLYFKALLQGLANMPAADEKIRAEIVHQAEQQGWPALHAHLKTIDPESANKISPNDSQRIQRAIEIYQLTGKTRTEHWQQPAPLNSVFNALQIALIPSDRQKLHHVIAQRFDAMLASGFIDEVNLLYQRGDLSLAMPAIRTVGYRQVWQYLAGELNETQMREKAIVATRQLAKRQLTWLRSWPDLHCFNSQSADFPNTALSFSQQYLSQN